MKSLPKLDISSLGKALASLEEAVNEHAKQPQNLFVRDATIQRFEYSYELTHKMLKRYLEMSEPNAAEIDQMSFPNLIRTAAEKGLLQQSWDQWKTYRDARNITSHTYNQQKAEQVCAIIPLFLQEAKLLLNHLNHRISQL